MIWRVIEAIQRHKFSFNDEETLQESIAEVLTAEGVPFEREHVLGPKERLDFLVDGSIAVEVKIKGSAPDLTRQLDRYCGHDRIRAVVLVTSSLRLCSQPETLRGKIIRVVYLDGLA